MAVNSSPPSPPSSKRGVKIRRFVKRVTSFANVRSSGRNSQGSAEAKAIPEEHRSPRTPPRPVDSPHDQDVVPPLPVPPTVQHSVSTSSSATVTSHTQQPIIVEPRQGYTSSVHSGELSDSQESSFSGLSALPSDYAQSATSSPEGTRNSLPQASLFDNVNRISTQQPVAHVETAAIPAIAEETHIQEEVPQSVPAAVSLPAVPDRAETAEESHPAPAAPETGNSLLLKVTTADNSSEEDTALSFIPPLESLTQLDSDFGADTSSSIVCPVEDEFELQIPSTAAVATDAVEDLMPTEEMIESPSSGEQDIPLPLEPTLPAQSEASSGPDPEFLDLDTPPEADVYAVGQPDAVNEEAVLTGPVDTLAESFALALPFEELAAEVQAQVDELDLDFESNEVEANTSSEESDVPIEGDSKPEVAGQPDAFEHVADRPVVEACPPPEIEELIFAEIPHTGSSAVSVIDEEGDATLKDLPTEVTLEAERPVFETCPPPEIEALISCDIPSVPLSLKSTEVSTPENEVRELVSEPETERPVFESCPPPDIEELMATEIPSLPLTAVSSEASTPANGLVAVPEQESERPVLEPCPPPEIEELIAGEIPSMPLSLKSTPGSLTPADESSTEYYEVERPVMAPCPPAEIEEIVSADIPSAASSSELPEVSTLASEPAPATTTERPTGATEDAEEPFGTCPSEDIEAAVVEDMAPLPVKDAPKAEPEDVAVSEHLSEEPSSTLEVVQGPSSEPKAATCESLSSIEQLVHTPAAEVLEDLPLEDDAPRSIDERPVLESFPSADDERAIATLLEDSPQPSEDQDTSPKLPDNDLAPRSTLCESECAQKIEDTAAAFDENLSTSDARDPSTESIAPDSTTNLNVETTLRSVESMPLANDTAEQTTDDSDRASVHSAPAVMERDVPDLVHSTHSSSSSDFGDELEDPPHASTVGAHYPGHRKRLPLHNRSVHLAVGYSLTWWLSKHPLF